MASTPLQTKSPKESTFSSSYDMSFGESDYEGHSINPEEDNASITKDYWFGKKYFECVMAQCLLAQNSIDESMTQIDSKFEDSIQHYPYGVGLQELRKQGLGQSISSAANKGDAYREMMACVGRVVRTGTREQRTVLVATMRRQSELCRVPVPTDCALTFPPSERGHWDSPRFREMVQNDNPLTKTSSFGHFASKLKEYGDQHAWIPEYSIERLSQVPPDFRAIVCCKSFTFEGTGRNKKQARHQAAQEACKFFGLLK